MREAAASERRGQARLYRPLLRTRSRHQPCDFPVGALPGGKAEKPELDPAGKQQGCRAGLAENRAKSPARADGGSRKPATHAQRHRRHAAGSDGGGP